MNSYYKQLLTAQFLRGASGFAFWMCAYLSLEGQGYPQTLIVTCFLALPIISFLTDMPTGIYADRVSCKAALIASGIVDLLAFLCLAFVAKHFWLAPIGFFLKGLGFSFENGAGSQMLFTEAEKIYGSELGSRRSSIHSELTSRFGSLIGGGLSALLVKDHPVLPWFVMLIAVAVNLGLVSQFKVEDHLKSRFSSFSLSSGQIWSSMKLALTLAFAPLFLFKLSDGFRMGTEGITFVPYISSILREPRYLALLPVLAASVRLPIVMLMWRGSIPIPKRIDQASLCVFLMIGVFIFGIGTTSNPFTAIAFATLNFALYSLRDIWSRHWENQIVSTMSSTAVTFRSAMTTAATGAQLIGTMLLSFFGGEASKSVGLWLGGGFAIVGMCVGIQLTVRRSSDDRMKIGV